MEDIYRPFLLYFRLVLFSPAGLFVGKLRVIISTDNCVGDDIHSHCERNASNFPVNHILSPLAVISPAFRGMNMLLHRVSVSIRLYGFGRATLQVSLHP